MTVEASLDAKETRKTRYLRQLQLRREGTEFCAEYAISAAPGAPRLAREQLDTWPSPALQRGASSGGGAP